MPLRIIYQLQKKTNIYQKEQPEHIRGSINKIQNWEEVK